MTIDGAPVEVRPDGNALHDLSLRALTLAHSAKAFVDRSSFELKGTAALDGKEPVEAVVSIDVPAAVLAAVDAEIVGLPGTPLAWAADPPSSPKSPIVLYAKAACEEGAKINARKLIHGDERTPLADVGRFAIQCVKRKKLGTCRYRAEDANTTISGKPPKECPEFTVTITEVSGDIDWDAPAAWLAAC